MGIIHNSDLIKNTINVGGLTNSDNPKETSEKVVFTADVTPRNHRIINVIRTLAKTTTGDGTIYTTPSDRDFYLVNAVMNFDKNATCNDGTDESCSITVVLRGDPTARKIITCSALDTTAKGTGVFLLQSPVPILLERGSAILLSGTAFTLGAKIRVGTIQGYTVDPSNNIMNQ